VRLYADSNSSGTFDTGDLPVGSDQTTDAGGHYLFSNLDAGNYFVQLPSANFSGAGVLAGYTSSSSVFSGDANNDKNHGTPVVGQGVISEMVTLTPGGEPIIDGDTDPTTNLTIDFGFYPLASIGNYVWLDTNKDGVQDGIETGVAGVNVQLYQPGKDGLAGTGDDVLVATTTTGSSGDYQFFDLVPGDYFVQFDLPPGYAHSPQDTTGDTSDSDADTTTGRTLITTLLPGEDDPSWDAGS